MRNKNKIVLSITGIVTVLLITIGLSYAYFSANLTGGEEATTLTVTGGTMNIVYGGGANINAINITPSDNAIATKTFTVTGNNTTDIKMEYKLSVVVESNSFSENALKYKLISTNTNNNGAVVPSINTFANIGTGSKTIELGIGEFTSPTGGNKIHTYNLELYFPNADYNQNIDQGKEFKAHIKIENINSESCKRDGVCNIEALKSRTHSFEEIIEGRPLKALVVDFQESSILTNLISQLNDKEIKLTIVEAKDGSQGELVHSSGEAYAGLELIIYKYPSIQTTIDQFTNKLGDIAVEEDVHFVYTPIIPSIWDSSEFINKLYSRLALLGREDIPAKSEYNSFEEMLIEVWYHYSGEGVDCSLQYYIDKGVDPVFCR